MRLVRTPAATVAVATVLASFFLALNDCPAAAGGSCSYGWTLSGSATDPFLNTGSPAGGSTTLYLWFQCAANDGMAAAEFDLAAGGVGTIAAFTPLNGFLNVGDETHLLLAVGGCPSGPILAGSIVATDTGTEFCIVPSEANGRSVTVDCDPQPSAHQNGTKGYSSLGGPPSCNQEPLCDTLDLFGACCYPNGTCDLTAVCECPGEFHAWSHCDDVACAPTTVAPTSWGRIKSDYR